MKLYYETVDPELLALIKDVFKDPFFNSYRLVGGTALALQIGHRGPKDADLFSDGHGQEVATIKKYLQKLQFDLSEDESNYGVYEVMACGVKLNLFHYGEPFVLPAREADGMRLASLLDIGLMKLDGQRLRNSWADLIDIYQIIKVHPMEELLEMYPRRYPSMPLKQPFMALINNLKNPPALALFSKELIFFQMDPGIIIKELSEKCISISKALIQAEAKKLGF